MSKIAFVFAGQGAQTVGMGQDLYENFEVAKELYDMSLEIRDLCFSGPKEKLDITVNTQAAVFITDLVCATILCGKGIKADGVAGFSLGEIAAACYAGLMEQEQAFNFVKHRAEAMHKCTLSEKGSMFAVLKLSNEKVKEICRTLTGAFPVNYNSPGQIVVACADETIENLQKAVFENGGRLIQLSVSGAFHSPLMDAASESVAAYLESEVFGTMQIPLYSNTTAQTYDNSNMNPNELLAKHVNHPVLWQKLIENMIDDAYDTFIEVGPGKTLIGLIKKINPDVHLYNVSDIISLDKTIEELKNA